MFWTSKLQLSFSTGLFFLGLEYRHVTGERKISLFQMKSNAHIKQLKYVKDKQIPEDKQCYRLRPNTTWQIYLALCVHVVTHAPKNLQRD